MVKEIKSNSVTAVVVLLLETRMKYRIRNKLRKLGKKCVLSVWMIDFIGVGMYVNLMKVLATITV